MVNPVACTAFSFKDRPTNTNSPGKRQSHLGTYTFGTTPSILKTNKKSGSGRCQCSNISRTASVKSQITKTAKFILSWRHNIKTELSSSGRDKPSHPHKRGPKVSNFIGFYQFQDASLFLLFQIPFQELAAVASKKQCWSQTMKMEPSSNCLKNTTL